MSKESVETRASASLCFKGPSERRWRADMAHTRISDENVSPTAPTSLVPAEIDQGPSREVRDLHVQPEQLRRCRAQSPAQVGYKVQHPKGHVDRRLVAVDDELHGRDGEWLVVIDVTSDGKVMTLLCCETATVSVRPASAVHSDVSGNRLKVYRHGMPDIPPELEKPPLSDVF